MKVWWRRIKLVVIDELRHSHLTREAVGWLLLLRGLLSRRDLVARGVQLTRALGFAVTDRLAAACIHSIHRKPGIEGAAAALIWSGVVKSLPRYRDLVRTKPLLDRSIILKAPGGNGEKGVLLLTFEYNWARLLIGLNEEQFAWVDEHYDLVLSTSWSPTDYAVLALALSRTKSTVFVQSCNYAEISRIERFHPRLKCLPTLPCDWINPDLYEPKPFSERTTDIVMVANWGEFKRHWDLFRALALMSPDLRVVLIGQPEGGRGIDTLRELAKDFGVRQELLFVESIPIAEVARHQCNAKVSVIMTRREGCCVAAVESLFAGCALAMRADAHVGPLAYITKDTGRRLQPGRIARDLQLLLERCQTMDSRRWALNHLAGRLSRQRVNAVLASSAIATGRPWTSDITLPQWRPHPTFAFPEESARMRPAYEELVRLAPAIFGPDLRTESWR